MSEEIDSLIGQTVGDYEITKLLGEGGMGVVYTGVHKHLGHKCAVKVLRREIMNNKEAVERFRQEARLIARVRHQNLIDIFDIGELPDGQLYYVMEFLSGQSLADLLDKQRLSFREIMLFMRQICAGLAAAHEAGIVHRDLKPENLFLVQRSGEPPFVKLVDFGIAKTVGVDSDSMKLTRTGSLIGTPFYMAPEQINGGQVDVRTDLYALGVILYQMCAGQLPFDGANLGEVLVGHLQTPAPPLPQSAYDLGVPQQIGPILAKLLAKEPAERYATVAEALADLDRLQRGEQTTAGMNSKLTLQALPKVVLHNRRRRVLLIALPVALVLLVVGGAFLGSKLKKADPALEIDMVSLRSLALSILQNGLADGDPSVRGQAIGALEDSRDGRHRSLLEGRLRDADPVVQAKAARALGLLGNRSATAALLQRADEGGDPLVLVTVGESLGKLGAPAGKALLLRSLAQEHYPQVQFQAALALLELGEEKATALLADQLKKKQTSEETRLEVLGRKALVGDEEAKAQLLSFLPTGALNQPRQLKATALLASLGDENARNRLSDTANQPGNLQVGAAHALCLLDDQTGQPLLRKTLWETSVGMQQRLWAAQGLGHCGDKSDAVAISSKLRGGEKSGVLRQAQAGALLKLCDGDPTVLAERSVSWAEQALSDDDWNVRAQAVATLGEVRNAKTLPLLRKAMTDKQAEVRKIAAASLAKLGGREAIVALTEGLRDESHQVRAQMIRGLVQAGKKLRQGSDQRPGSDSSPGPSPGSGPDSSGDAATQQLMMNALRTGVENAGQAEKLARAAAMAAMGDKTAEKEAEKIMQTGDAETQAMAVAMASDVPDQKLAWLSRIVADEKASASTRLQAALSLAQNGSRVGLEVLKEAAARGGSQAVRAQLALQKLGEAAPIAAEQVQKSLQTNDAEERRKTVEALGEGSPAQALPHLYVAARDASLLVRSQALDTAVALLQKDGGQTLAPVIGLLSRDRDGALSERARAVLSKLKQAPTPDRPVETSAQAKRTTEPTNPADPGKKPTELPGPPPTGPETPGPAATGYLRFIGPPNSKTPIQIQIDKQTAQNLPDKPVEVTAGEHVITYPGGQQTVTVRAGESVSVKIAPSQLIDLVKAGIEAFQHKDYRKARKLLEKASTLCVRKKEEKTICHAHGFELAFHLGQTYEAQEAWALAMNEYDRIGQPGFFGKVKADGTKAVAEAMKRLAPKVGRLRISKIVKGQCQTEDVWMPPGRHRVNVGSGQTVQVRPQEIIEVKGCP